MTSGSLGYGLAQHRPVNIGPQVFAAHGAAGRAFDRRAPLGRHLSAHRPVAHVLGFHPKGGRQLGNTTGGADGLFDGSHAQITHYVDQPCQQGVLWPDSPDVYAVKVSNETPIERVLRLAKERGWNQSDLAGRLGVSSQNVTNWKQRGMPADKLLQAAAVLGCSTDYLAGNAPGGEVRDSVFSLDAFSQKVYAYTVPPTKTTEEIVAGVELGREFRYVLVDDALAPDRPKGLSIIWSTERQPRPGTPVLVMDSHKRLHARLYAQGRTPEQWMAVSTHRGYVELDSQADGLRLVATAMYREEP